jgi:hypothetical protein
MRRKDLTEVARLQLAASGLAVLHIETLYAAMPAAWANRQEALLRAPPLAEIVTTLAVEYPTATFIEFNTDGAAMLAVTRSLNMIEERLEYLTGRTAKTITVVEPNSVRHREKTKIPELKQPVVDEFERFNQDDFLKTLPTWSCATRTEGILKLQRFWRRHPDLYRPEVYDASERAMRTAFDAEMGLNKNERTAA